MKKIVITLLMCMLLMSGCGSESEEFLELADQYYAEGQYEHAAYNYVRALELDRENKDAYMNLIDSYMELWKLDDAMDYLEEAELMFGARAVEDKRAILEGMLPEPTPKKEEPIPTEVPVVEETPIPEVTVVPTDAPVVEPTEVPEPTVTSAPEYTFTDVDATMYVTADVNVRTLPSTDGKKVGSLSKDTKIDVLRQCNETGWYEFEYDGELRYASSKYFSTEKPEVKVTSTPVPTSTPTPKPTSKPEPTATATPKPTATSTPIPTEKPKATATPVPTVTAIPTLTTSPTQSPVPTNIPVSVGENNQVLTATEIYDMCSRSVVLVDAGVSLGTGFFVENNVIVTNYHVIDDATELMVKFITGDEYTVLEVLGYSEKYDIALLKVDCIGSPLMYNTHGVSVGEKTYTIGNSLGISHTLTDGIITNKDLVLDEVNYILTNTAISHGNSGGPLLNEYGEVIGITTSSFIDGQNMNCAVEISQIYNVDTSEPISKSDYISLHKEPSKTISSENIHTNLEHLKSYILSQGYLNQAGNYAIKYIYDKTYTVVISYESENDWFSFTILPDEDDIECAINFYWNDWLGDTTTVDLTFVDTVLYHGYRVQMDLNIPLYCFQDLDYIIIDKVGDDSGSLEEYVIEYLQSAFKVGMGCFDILLLSELGLQLNDIGFASYDIDAIE